MVDADAFQESFNERRLHFEKESADLATEITQVAELESQLQMVTDEVEELAPAIKSKQEQIQGTELLIANMNAEAEN